MRRVLWVQREPQVLLGLLARRVLWGQPELSGLLALASRVLPAQTQPYLARQVQSALRARGLQARQAQPEQLGQRVQPGRVAQPARRVLALPAHKARLVLRVPLLA